MASLGTVQATLSIDAGSAIASIDAIGKKSTQAASALQNLGRTSKDSLAGVASAGQKAADALGNVAAQQEKAAQRIGNIKLADIFGNAGERYKIGGVSDMAADLERVRPRVEAFAKEIGNTFGLVGAKAEDIFRVFEGKKLPTEWVDAMRRHYTSAIDAMVNDNRLFRLLPEKLRTSIAGALKAQIPGQLSGGGAEKQMMSMFNNFERGAIAAESRAVLLNRAFVTARAGMAGLSAVAGAAAAGIGVLAAGAAGAIGAVSALQLAYKGLVTTLQKAPAFDVFQRAESYESGLRRVSVQAAGQGNGLSRSDYDVMARDFSRYANVTRTEALEIAKAITMVGNIGQTAGAKIRKGTQVASEAYADLTKSMRMVVDYTALMGGDSRNAKDVQAWGQNLRVAFSSFDNMTQLASNVKLFTAEQQKSIEKTRQLKGETEALSEAFSYLPENLAGIAEQAQTPLERAFDSMRSSVRAAWDGIADAIGWDSIAQNFAGLLENIGGQLSGWLSGNKDWLAPMMRGIADGVIAGVNLAVDALGTLGEKAVTAFQALSNNAAVQGFLDLLSSVASAIWAVGDAAFEVFSAAVDFGVWIADLLHLDEIFGALVSTIGTVMSVIGDLVSLAVDGWRLIIDWTQRLWEVVSAPDAWGYLGTMISQAIDWFRNLWDKATSYISGIKNAIASMFSAAGGIWQGIKDRAKEAVGMASARATAAASVNGVGSSEASAKIDNIRQDVSKLDNTLKSESTKSQRALEKWSKGGTTSGGGGGGRRGGGGGRTGKTDAERQAERDAKNADRYLKSLREQAHEINRLTKLERLRYDIETGAIVLNAEQLRQAEEFARLIDDRVVAQRRERIEIELATQALQNRREAEDAALRVHDIGAAMQMPDRILQQMQEVRSMSLDFERQLQDLANRERSEVIGKSDAEVTEIREKYARMAQLAEEGYNERVKWWLAEVELTEQTAHDIGANYHKGLLEVADWYAQLGSDVRNATTSWANGAADSLAQFVRKGKLDFKSLADSILDDIARIASRQFVSAIAGGVTGGWTTGGGGGSSGGSFFSGIGSAIGGFFRRIFGFADGGYTGAGAKHQPAGVVHAGEFVINAASTKRIAEEFGWDFLRRLNGYADGGYVTPMPSIVKSGGLVADSDIEVNIYNQTDSQVTARRNSNNGALEVFVRQAVDAVASNIASGGNVAAAMQQTYALNRGMGVQRRGF